MRVLKFGGKSLDSKEKFKNVCEFIKEIYKTEKQLIIVVSAIGNTTNELLNLSEEFGNNKNSSNLELAKLLSTGEIQSASLFSMRLNSIGVPAKSFSGKDIELKTFGDYNNSRISYLNKSILKKYLTKNIVAVVAGFQGVNSSGEITTLGRGGSDTTAVALATVFNVSAEIYSDYDGVFLGDPKENDFKKINLLSFESMKQMSKCGSKVIDYRAISLAKNFKTKIISKSSSEPNKNGTIISNLESDIISISKTENLCKISIFFSNENKLNFIIKNVFLILNKYNFYNFSLNKNIIEFFILKENTNEIYTLISQKLNLINKNK